MVVSDIFFGWAVEVARKHGVVHSVFLTTSSFGGAVYFSLWINLPHVQSTSDQFPLPEYPDITVCRSQLPKHLLVANGSDPWSIFLQRVLNLCCTTDIMLVNTIDELEPKGFGMQHILKRSLDIPILPIGPLLCSSSTKSLATESEMCTMRWLDSQQPKSVLYISFGSQNTIRANQIMELALGLEASGRPFVWAIRPPVGLEVKSKFDAEWLPVGFEERMKQGNRGLLVHGWAPQVQILAHPSTGAFLSHSGWNSVLESLNNGVPIIAWPIGGEQFYNAMMLSDLGVCVEVARGNSESSEAERHQIEEVIEKVMGESDMGKEIRRKAADIRGVINSAWEEDGGSSLKALKQFLKISSKIGSSCHF